MRKLLFGILTVLLMGGFTAAATGSAFAAEKAEKSEKADAKGGKAEGGKDAKGGEEKKGPAVQGSPGGPLFMDLPDILVNLDTGNQKPAYLKVHVALQVAKESDAPLIQGFMPRILDDLTLYLREMRPDTLKDPKTLERLRQELLKRVGQEIKPVKVSDILFREFLIQ